MKLRILIVLLCSLIFTSCIITSWRIHPYRTHRYHSYQYHQYHQYRSHSSVNATIRINMAEMLKNSYHIYDITDILSRNGFSYLTYFRGDYQYLKVSGSNMNSLYTLQHHYWIYITFN